VQLYLSKNGKEHKITNIDNQGSLGSHV
jgi:hypothetical protein